MKTKKGVDIYFRMYASFMHTLALRFDYLFNMSKIVSQSCLRWLRTKGSHLCLHSSLQLPCFGTFPSIYFIYHKQNGVQEETYLFLTGRRCNNKSEAFQKGGVPAAPSGTATLLRLSPNHQFYPRTLLAVTYFRYPRLSWLDGRCVQGPGTYSPRRG